MMNFTEKKKSWKRAISYKSVVKWIECKNDNVTLYLITNAFFVNKWFWLHFYFWQMSLLLFEEKKWQKKPFFNDFCLF